MGAVKGVKDHDKREIAEGAMAAAIAAYLVESGRGHEVDLPRGAKLEVELERALYLVKNEGGAARFGDCMKSSSRIEGGLKPAPTNAPSTRGAIEIIGSTRQGKPHPSNSYRREGGTDFYRIVAGIRHRAFGTMACLMPKLTFLGDAGTVTGSKYLVEAGGKKLLLDCGIFQGSPELQDRNYDPLAVDPKTINSPC